MRTRLGHPAGQRVCDRVFVLDRGTVVLSGPTGEIRSQLEALEEVYLGTADDPTRADLVDADDPVMREQENERLSARTSKPRPGNPMVAAVAALVGIVATFLPWFDIAPFGGPVTTETAPEETSWSCQPVSFSGTQHSSHTSTWESRCSET